MKDLSPFINSLVSQNFFFMTSGNYESFESCFYGYSIGEDAIYIHENPDHELLEKYTAGVWVNIVADERRIIIQQDYFCSFGLYVFRNGGFWAVSNNLLHMIQLLRDNYELSINHEYISLFIAQRSLLSAVGETVINEIRELGQEQYLEINKKDGSLNIVNMAHDKYSIELCSKEALNLLDGWHNKYKNIFGFLAANGYNVTVELSGGMDSRAALACVIPLLRDGKDVNVYSIKRDDHTFKEDYKIAQQIADVYGFSLKDANPQASSLPVNNEDRIWFQLYCAFFVSDNQLYFDRYLATPSFKCTGYGGEVLRAYGHGGRNEYMGEYLYKYDFNSKELIKNIEVFLSRQFSYLDVNYPEDSDFEDAKKIYLHSRVRNHFMRNALAGSLINNFAISPLLDPELRKLDIRQSLHSDPNMLFAIIYDRYLPEISEMGFNARRFIAKETMEKAQELNCSFPPATSQQCSTVKLSIKQLAVEPSEIINKQDKLQDYLYKSYCSCDVKMKIIHDFNYEIYYFPISRYKQGGWSQCNQLTRMLTIYYLDNILKNKSIFPHIYEQYYKTGYVKDFLGLINSARIDMINEGPAGNTLNLISSNDPDLVFSKPVWLSKEGKGLTCQTGVNKFKMAISVAGSGNLRLYFRGIHRFNKYGKEITIKTDYETINIYSRTRNIALGSYAKKYGLSVWKPFFVSFNVDDNEIIEISINYLPHDYLKTEIDEILLCACDAKGIS